MNFTKIPGFKKDLYNNTFNLEDYEVLSYINYEYFLQLSYFKLKDPYSKYPKYESQFKVCIIFEHLPNFKFKIDFFHIKPNDPDVHDMYDDYALVEPLFSFDNIDVLDDIHSSIDFVNFLLNQYTRRSKLSSFK